MLDVFSLQHRLQERASMLRYTHINSLVSPFFTSVCIYLQLILFSPGYCSQYTYATMV
jgi:hypothetical protein